MVKLLGGWPEPREMETLDDLEPSGYEDITFPDRDDEARYSA